MVTKQIHIIGAGCAGLSLAKYIKMGTHHDPIEINFYGIDIIKEMISQAKKENRKTKTSNKINYINKDFLKMKIKKCDLILSYYTIQFMPPRYRQTLINKIYNSLNWGGGFIMFEKIRASDARFQDIFTLTYNDFKLKNNFSPAEIIYKSKSLKGVMEPFSDYGNTSLIKRAGFKDYIPVFQWLCFKGYLCIK